jgi:hypothetical protein
MHDKGAERAPARRRVGRWCWAPAWTGQRGVARAATKRPTAARTKVRGGLVPSELLTLLLTPGEFPAREPSCSWAFQANDRKSSKQPLVCLNHTGGVARNRSHAGIWLSQGKQSQGRARPRSSRRRPETVIGCLGFKRMSRSVQSGQPNPAVAHRSVLPAQAGIARAAPAAPF